MCPSGRFSGVKARIAAVILEISCSSECVEDQCWELSGAPAVSDCVSICLGFGV